MDLVMAYRDKSLQINVHAQKTLCIHNTHSGHHCTLKHCYVFHRKACNTTYMDMANLQLFIILQYITDIMLTKKPYIIFTDTYVAYNYMNQSSMLSATETVMNAITASCSPLLSIATLIYFNPL